jgi:hypothetical protein
MGAAGWAMFAAGVSLGTVGTVTLFGVLLNRKPRRW